MRRMPRFLIAGALLILAAACSSAPEVRPVMMVSSADAAQSAPEDPYEQGKAHLRAGRPGLAVHALQIAVARDASDVRALSALGVAYDRLGRFDLADRHYRQALALAPGNAVVLNNKGWSHYLRGRDDLAAFYLQRARAAAATDTRAATSIAGNLRHVEARRAAARGERTVTAMDTPPDDVRLERLSRREHRLALPTRAEALPLPTPATAVSAPATVEVSNGTGRAGMAARMAAHLRAREVTVERLTNAAHFSHRRSLILYRPAHATAARALAERLPADVEMRATPEQTVPLRLLLGADLLEFDRSLWRARVRQERQKESRL